VCNPLISLTLGHCMGFRKAKRTTLRGAAAVEGALIFALLLLITLGIYEAGRAWLDYNIITHATREGARFASTRPSLTANDGAVRNKINNILGDAGLTATMVEVLFTPPLQTGEMIRVRSRVIFTSVLSGFLPPGWQVAIPLTAEVVTRYEA